MYPLFEVILDHFGHLLGFPVKTVCNPSLPGIQASRENGTLPIGVISEVLARVDFALPACLGPKSTLGRTSELTSDGWCTVFFAHRFRKSLKMAQNHLEWGARAQKVTSIC